MTKNIAGSADSYLATRLRSLRTSISKRYHRLLYAFARDRQRRRYLQELHRQSRQKPSLATGALPRTDRRLDAARLEIRTLALYLPQFHPFAENDLWWGKGFTEWRNVTRAVPQYLGHYQPRLPGDLGFYDLRLPEVMREQIEMARDYGIHGFCFYQYWFNGRRLLDMPVNNFFADTSLDFPFCLCWANENWSRRWDGSDTQILMPQNHGPEDDIAYIDNLIPMFKDGRYIRVDGRPVLIVYRVSLFPDIAATARRWRQRVKEHGIDDLYLVTVWSFDRFDPRDIGFDAAMEFPPNGTQAVNVSHLQTAVSPDFKGKVYDYADLAARAGKTDQEGFVCHKSVMPSWDNTARRMETGSSFVNTSPERYARWLDDAIAVTMRRPADQRLLFVNAWNEWAEGATLEPDRRYGYASLAATASALSRVYRNDDTEAFITAHNAKFRKTSDTALVLHLYYEDLLTELMDRYLADAGNADLFVSVRFDVPLPVLQAIASCRPNSRIIRSENRGRDIYPFLLALRQLVDLGYRQACKLHSKKSPHLGNGEQWRTQLASGLLGHAQALARAESHFAANPKLGLMAPPAALRNLAEREVHQGNRVWLDRLLGRLGQASQKGRYRFRFPAGSMFWFRVPALEPLLGLGLGVDDFEHELGQIDGTLAHAIERLFVLVADQAGYTAQEADLSSGSTAA